MFSSKSKGFGRKGFDVEVRKKGKWEKINKKPFNKRAANDFGFDAVDNSAAASYRLKANPKEQKLANYFSLNSIMGKSKFRKKKEGDFIIHIEKRGKGRIDTPGEVAGISAKGWASQRLKKMKSFGGFI